MKTTTSIPQLEVCIVKSETITFSFNGTFTCLEQNHTGSFAVRIQEDQILWNGETFDNLIFAPTSDTDFFELDNVEIGIQFHWNRKERQRFQGKLSLIIDQGKLCAINHIDVESYLISVISSEMCGNASPDLLKAHAVISRSWVLKQLENFNHPTDQTPACELSADSTEKIKWYDRDDHTLYHLCADDHCQRYYGLLRSENPHVRAAVSATKGQVIAFDGQICDARYSKCCGGIMELFENCWEDSSHPYLKAYGDTANGSVKEYPSMSEEEAVRFINSSPEAFCNTTDKTVLQQVLNEYDFETQHFYRWEVVYTQEEIRRLLLDKAQLNLGEIVRMDALERGPSGRIIRLRITGTEQTITIGKELEIRRSLSPSHLYSSAFITEYENLSNDIPQTFRLKGAGWGHGVGLCQIGAAVMAEKGYDYKQILSHYYPQSEPTEWY